MQSNRTTPSRVAGTGTTILLLLLGILLILAALYFCLTQIRPAIEAELSDKVTTSLADIGLTDENVLVTGQDVMLVGEVSSQSIQAQAQQRATDVYGVARVYNNLRLQGETDPNDNQPTDTNQNTSVDSAEASAVTSQAESTPVAIAVPDTDTATTSTSNEQSPLVLEESLSPSTLEISVSEGRAVVQGIVPDEESIDRIIAAVSGKYGSTNVEDDMSTYIGSAKPRWLDGAIALIDQIDQIDNAAIKITQSKASVSGSVSSDAMAEQKSALTERLLSKYLDVQTNLTVATPPAELPAAETTEPETQPKRPASLKVSSDTGNPTVSGTLSTEREADQVRAGIGRMFQGNFVDQLLVDDSVANAPWIQEALAITDTVQSVEQFSVSINSGQLLLGGNVSDRISGRALASAVSGIAGNTLNVVNNFSPTSSTPVSLSAEELMAQELQAELNRLNTADIVFEKGSTTLTDNAKSVLNQAADIILGYQGQVVEIAGHTDSSGDALANLQLSKKRAIAVQEYLADRQVPIAQLSPIGYGETDPIADNQTAEGQAANRRIEFNL